MIRIAILDQNAYQFDNIFSNLQQTGFAATTELDGENLSAWLAKHGVDMLMLPLPNENERPIATSISKRIPKGLMAMGKRAGDLIHRNWN